MRPGKKLGCSTIAFRSEPLETALQAIRELGFPYADIGAMPGFCPHFDFADASVEEEERFVAQLLVCGVQIHTFTTHLGHMNVPEADLARMQEAASRSLRVAKRVGAYGVNVNCGGYRNREQHPLEHDLSRVTDFISPLAVEAEELGLKLMVEAPHKGNLIRTADEALSLIKKVSHPNCGLIFDCNHHHAAGWSMPEAVRRVASHIRLIHLRDAVGTGNAYPLGAGEIDLGALIRTLDGIGYDGVYSLELTDAAPTLDGVKQALRESRRFFERITAEEPLKLRDDKR